MVTINVVTFIISHLDFYFNIVIWISSEGTVHKTKISLEEKLNRIQRLDVDANLLHFVHNLHKKQSKLEHL